MYVCMYVCMYVRTYVRTCVCIYIYIYAGESKTCRALVKRMPGSGNSKAGFRCSWMSETNNKAMQRPSSKYLHPSHQVLSDGTPAALAFVSTA